MKVRLTTDRAGTLWEQHEGDIVDLPAEEASRLIAARQAEPLDNETSAPALVGTPAGASDFNSNQKHFRKGRR